MLNETQARIFQRAVATMSDMVSGGPQASAKTPLLYGPDNKPIFPSGNYAYKRQAAKREGSMKNWIPRRLLGRQEEALERERIVERSIDLVQNDPNAAGILDGFAHTVIGSGLSPQPMIDRYVFPEFDKEKIRKLQQQQLNVYRKWNPFADAGSRMSAGQIQFLVKCSLLEYGEYLVLLPMIDDPTRPYSLACQVINPLRLKTPLDLINKANIRDGVEMGEYGEPVAYWIKRSDAVNPLRYWADVSPNFMRIPARVAHRWNVLHGFICKEPEQVRGMPLFATGMKLFRDLNDYLDAELVSNIVTAAFSLFIETEGDNPLDYAKFRTSRTEEFNNPDSETESKRYEELTPGLIMYGQTGQVPHPIAANRPGATFEPFTQVIKKAIAMAIGVPYPVAFKDVEGVNFAGFRSAMLDAWRVFSNYRVIIGKGFCQKVFTMLQEEAYLLGELDVDDFYSNMQSLTEAEWWGSPKGDIEPIKEIESDVIAIKNRLKTRAEAIRQRGGDWRAVFEQLEEEEDELASRGLDIDLSEPTATAAPAGTKTNDEDQTTDDKDQTTEGSKGNKRQ